MQDENNNNTAADDQDLLSRLNIATEKKAPTANPVKSFAWDDDGAGADPADAKNNPDAQPATTTKAAGAEKKLSPEEIKRAAEASAAGVELITSLLSEAIINLRYYFKFTDEERIELDEKILDEDPNILNPDQRKLKSRYERLMERRDKKLDKVSVSDKARAALEKSFEAYTEETGKTFLTPKSRLWVYISEHAIKTVIAAVTD